MKWLKDLEGERRRLQEKREAEEKEKVKRKRSFMERDAEKLVPGKTDNDASESPSLHRDTLGKYPISAISTISTISASNASPSAAPIASDNKKTKPAWCQSEATHEASEMDAETNLLSFVEGLDFDQYTQDLELQALIGQLKERINTLERENKKDQTKLQTCLDVSSSICTSLKNSEHF